ncbi:RNA-binding protein NOB1-like [Mercenaria mercenaria]|uniref:RNA-binding protein NOB1-like n=1 Tax=Mercenaria mercenaria TaxID=6596 RepID=UPI00234F01B2|nr:RNA-binding protein NOB1-like [Mercenaria mercenaria]
MATVKHVVLDSGAFIKNVKVQDIAENVYTIPEVVSEIKDKATKQRLQVLPYELIFKEPSSDAIKIVTEFSKKTGDYRSLSAVDIKVMALAYMLEKEFVGTDHIKTEPDKKVEWNASKRPLEKATDIAGFYVKTKKSPSSRTTSECSSVNPEETDLRSDDIPDRFAQNNQDSKQTANEIQTDTVNTADSTNSCEIKSGGSKQNVTETNENDKTEIDIKDEREMSCNKFEDLEEGGVIPDDMIGEESESEEEDEDDEDEDDDDGWITPSNIKSVKEKMGGGDVERAEVQVGCLTTDFAMQNVLIQMGLSVVSVDGMLIKRAKSFVLRCFACFKITTQVEKTFCPQCGNKTLTKVSMTVNDDGSIKYFLSKRRRMNLRGTKYSLPMPKGGKHAANPRLVADQPSAQNRISNKARAKMDVFDPDYIASSSPFAVNDVTSRAAQLGIRSHKGQTHYWERKNPNAVKKNRRK